MKPILRILIGILIGASAALIGISLYGRLSRSQSQSAPVLPTGPAAVITHVSGPVFVIRGEQTLGANPGERLEAGDILKVTDGAVAQVQMAEKGSALLGSNTLVRFLTLTGASHQLEIRTEILTGSMSYKVEQLEGDQSIIILSDDTEYQIRGTEFIIVKESGRTILAMADGRMEVRGPTVAGGRVEVGAKEQLVTSSEAEPAVPEDLSSENQKLLEASRPMPMMPFGFEAALEPVRLDVYTVPQDALIYVDGLKTGIGNLSSLLPRGTVIELRVRRRGFLDYSAQVAADTSQTLRITLVPQGLRETLEEKNEEDKLLNRIEIDYERRLAEINADYSEIAARAEKSRQIFTTERQALQLEASEAARREAETAALLEMERARRKTLEAELSESRAENDILRARN